jgi:hypothetical protein
MGCGSSSCGPLAVEIMMSSWKQGIVAALIGLALAGCAGGGRVSDGPQSFLGISQDISSVFSTGDSLRSPLRPSFLAD